MVFLFSSNLLPKTFCPNPPCALLILTWCFGAREMEIRKQKEQLQTKQSPRASTGATLLEKRELISILPVLGAQICTKCHFTQEVTPGCAPFKTGAQPSAKPESALWKMGRTVIMSLWGGGGLLKPIFSTDKAQHTAFLSDL